MNEFIRNIKKFFIRRYHRLRQSDVVWSSVLNRRPRREWAVYNRMHPLTDSERGIVRELQTQGIATRRMDEVFGDAALFRLLNNHARKLKDKWEYDAAFRQDIERQKSVAQKGAKKDFLKPLYGGGWIRPVLDLEDPTIRFALHDTIVRLVAGYMEMVPRFCTFSLAETVIVDDASEARLSQRWHRDYEDRKMCKVFVYLSDVLNDGAGPFTYVRESTHRLKYGALFPQTPPNGSYPKEGELEKHVDSKDILKCFGAAGTVVFADTSGLHRGGFSTTVSRTMITAGFTSPGVGKRETFTLPKTTNRSALSLLAQRTLYV